jgi:hypothetical protein
MFVIVNTVLCSVCSILKKRAPFNWGGVVSYLGLVVDQLIVCTGSVIEISFFFFETGFG